MPYNTRSDGQRLSSIIDSLRETGLSYTFRSSKMYALAASISAEIGLTESFFSDNAYNSFLRSATGRELEALGEIFGVRRVEGRQCNSIASESNIQFYVQGGNTFGSINGESDIILPAGTIIQTEPLILAESPIQYQLTSSLDLIADSSIAWANASAIVAGAGGRIGPRTLIQHDFNGYTGAISNSLRVINNYAIVNGAAREADTNLRFRISKAATALQTGNNTSLYNAALRVPGVVDLSIIPYFDGIGTVAIFVVGQDNQGSESLVREVQINLNSVQSAGILATAYSPSQLGISFQTRVHTTVPLTINEKNELRQRLTLISRSAITNLGIGEPLAPAGLANTLLRSSTQIIDLGTLGGDYFDRFGMWRISLASPTSSQRVRSELLSQSNISMEPHEIMIPEMTLTNPFVFTFTS